ncbi:MAG: DUF1800 domain-containing protein [Chitinophagaceae bacterium]|nr:DUF1800 domain-containing protein [Chitinophagaceae bacterium]
MGNVLTRRDWLRIPTNPPKSDGEKLSSDQPASEARTFSGLSPYSGPWSEPVILHLLRRTTFGASKQHVETLKSLSVAQAIDLLIDNPPMPADRPVNNYSIDFNNPNQFVDTEGCPFGANWVDHIPPSNWQTHPDIGTLEFWRVMYSFVPWWFGQLINQPLHIMERLNLFWVNHFGVLEEDHRQAKAIWKYYYTIRTHAAGNFRDMVKAVTIDPTMLFFLNGHYNSKEAPDENYARELQELYMVGKGPGSAYTEDDVREAARVLTGWRRTAETDGRYTSYFDQRDHDRANKQFSAFYNNQQIEGQSGQNGMEETDELIEMILQTNECSKYICRELYKWFVYYKIDSATEANVIEPLAAIFRANNFDVTPVLKALIGSEHFFDAVNRGCMIKSPVDLYVSLLREFNIQLANSPLKRKYTHWRYFKDRCDAANQRIGDPPNVSGWPAYYQEPVYYRWWITSDTINKRLKALNDLTRPGVDVDGFAIKVDSIAYNKLSPAPSNPNLVVSNFILYLLPQGVSQEQYDFMKSILLSNQVGDYYWSNAWNAHIAEPGNELAEATVRSRLDTLINYITSMEEYQLF